MWKYKMQPLEAEVLEKLRKMIDNVSMLDSSCRVEIEIFENLGVNLVEHIVIAGNTYTRILQSLEERFNTNK